MSYLDIFLFSSILVFFFSHLRYCVHRLLLASIGRREVDDRDHYGNKRLDLAGPLLAFLFRGLFKNLLKEVRIYAQKFIDKGKASFLMMIRTTSIDHDNNEILMMVMRMKKRVMMMKIMVMLIMMVMMMMMMMVMIMMMVIRMMVMK